MAVVSVVMTATVLQTLTTCRIFIIEGCFTVLMSVFSYFWLVDWPVDSKFLNDEERKVLLTRLSVDNEGEARMDRINWRRCLMDRKVWLG